MPTTPLNFVAYIDEAGEHGDQFGNGSSKFLTMGAAIVPEDQPDIATELFQRARQTADRRNAFKRFSSRKTRDSDRFILTGLFPQFDIKLVQIGFYKPSLGNNWFRKSFQTEYNFLIKFTLERVSWAVRDAVQATRREPGTCKLVFSESDMQSYDHILEYLSKLKAGRGNYNCSVNWEFVGDLEQAITVSPHEDETGTHLGDIAASAFHRAIETKKFGMTDDRFQRRLHPCLYKRNGTIYGLKLFPPDAISALRRQGELELLQLLNLPPIRTSHSSRDTRG